MGRRGERGVPVLLLLFRPEGAVEGSDAVREVLAPGEALPELSEERLAALLDVSEPFKPLPPPSPDTSRRRSGRRRG